MLASAALIASILKSQIPSNESNLDSVAIEKAATFIGLDSDASSATTASQTTVVDAGIRLQSQLQHLVQKLLTDKTDKISRLLHVNHVLDYVSYALSDMVFVYPGTSGTYLGEELLPLDQSIKNVNGKSVRVVRMDTRDGALQAVQGALEHSDIQATVLASSQALYSMLPMIHLFANQKAPVVFHVAGQGVNSELVSQSEMDAVLAARQSGAVLLASGSVQEAHDLAIAAYIISKQLQVPVIHYFDGTLVKNYQKVKVSSFATLATQVETKETSASAILARQGYSSFTYYGDKQAETVLVALSTYVTPSLLEAANTSLGIGLLAVRAYRPWQEDEFLKSISPSVRRIVVLEQGDGLYAYNGPLYLDVTSALRVSQSPRPRVVTAQAPNFNHLHPDNVKHLAQRATSVSFVDLLGDDFVIEKMKPAYQEHGSVFRAALWDLDQDGTSSAGAHIAQLVHSQDPEQAGASQVICDSLRVGGGVSYTQIVCNSNDLNVGFVNYIGIHNADIIKEYDVLANAAKNVKVLLHGPWQHGDDIEAVLPNTFKLVMTQVDAELYTLDVARILQELSLNAQSAHVIDEIAFFLLNSPNVDPADVLANVYHDTNGEVKNVLADLTRAVKANLTSVALLPPWTILERDDAVLPTTVIDRPDLIKAISQGSECAGSQDEQQIKASSWHEAAWQVMFKEAYSTDSLLRPDLHEKNYLVTLTENRRLTPSTYDRNVFHLEFDTSSSNLKYELGDALGVHGHNDTEDVKKFIKWYGLNENDVVSVPVGPLVGARTVFQLFAQVLDLFGRPTKKFYEGLAEVATDDKERQQLEFLISPEGKESFKERVDDTITYEDLLHEFPSARPSLEQLMSLVSPIKPRHYSIASSQKMHGSSVHLLVVAVDWANRAGKMRFGQCTRYLANLAIGSQVTVSIKPSVMKLPPLDTQPVIMAGLGTGMAPFRAFIQERYMAKQAGKEIGPVVLYFGSRNRSNEYLYGEELEAYFQDGVLSHMGLAFSRDQKQKVYIQHKMKDDAALLSDYLINKNGHFYLCGPTWPVPDVKDAVVHGLTNFGGIQEKDANALIEEWKEKERYILEVY
ncbi:hypothetical protein DM01DRAFT_1326933 [Hesseltinella vesiculosa]|uniref:assimilatory sulfite reductase (NADPH) n=1 Tax=Hesseltinella vesiculosa TaxID=101127 RepID=A0A1X2G8P8_9FUNG|nr:hypothetical protein DM01DRAFT_1326933 [Hesseltinella vesiculosa]